MKIAVTNQESLFAFFYVLSFAVSFVIVIGFSLKRKIPIRSVLLMMTTLSLMTIIGSRLMAIPFSQWGQLISSGSFDGYYGRFAIGGLVFGLAGLIISLNLLGIDKSILRLYGWLTPLGLGIQKTGCFFNGCCYGTPSNLPWAVQYPVCTNAHYFQWSRGIITENAAWSLPLHPVQLYEAAGLFLVAFIVWKIRNRWKNNWSVVMFALCLLCISRFSTEFFRDPSTTYFAGGYLWGIKKLQWILLISAVLFVFLLSLSEKLTSIGAESYRVKEPDLNSSILYLIALTTVTYLFRGLLSKFEVISLDIKLVPAILLIGIHISRSLPVIKSRLATTSFLLFPLFLITQIIPQDTLKQHKSVESFYRNDIKDYTRIDLGTSIGDFYGDIAYNPHEGQCGKTYTHEYYKHEFRMFGMGISRVKYSGRSIGTYGINVFGGSHQESNLTTPNENKFFLAGINPYFKYDMRWVGMGAGLNIGNLRWIPITYIDQTTFNYGTRFSPVMPEVSLRVGRKDILDIRYNYGRNFPSSFPVLTHELSIGTGLGTTHLMNFRLGIAYEMSENWFVSAEILPDKVLGLNLKYAWGRSYFNSPRDHFSWLTVNANYRFGFNKNDH